MELEQLIGLRIREIRKKAGITQLQLSEEADLGLKYIAHIERGRKNPTLGTIIKIAKACKVDLDQFFVNIQIQDPKNRRDMIDRLLDKADDEQLKFAYQILSLIIK